MIKVIGLNTKVLKKEPFSGSHHGIDFAQTHDAPKLVHHHGLEPWTH